MTLGGALKALLGDLAALFPRRGARTWFLLAAAAVLQVAFWYLASPGPQLIGYAPRDLPTAMVGITWTVVILLALPALLFTTTGGSLKEMGLTRGDHRFGWPAVAVCVLIAVPVVALSSGDASGLAGAYPWAGDEIGRSLGSFLGWALLYALYYLAFEAFYRGFLLRTLDRQFGTVMAVWLQAFAATLVHLGKPLPEVLAALPASLLFGVIAVRTRSVVYPALVHLAIGLTLDLVLLARAGTLLS